VTEDDDAEKTPIEDGSSSKEQAAPRPEWISSKYAVLADYAAVVDKDNNTEYTLDEDPADADTIPKGPCGCCDT
jgi:hypothetical protein